jgi:indole-3-glycerol phosphate synthase
MSEIPSILQRIVEKKRDEVAAAKTAMPRPDVAGLPPTRDFAGALSAGETIRLIAEVKRASPTRGVFRTDFDPVGIAMQYAAGGASAISVLTDESFFHGHPSYLAAIRAAVPVPIFRKEFIIDPWQIDESRRLGADALLLIAALLSRAQIQEFLDQARALSLGVLVEVHDEAELERALGTDAGVIGVNNRNLNTFETTLATTERLAAAVKQAGRLLVSESGIFTQDDLARLAPLGVDAVLVGEALIREGGPPIADRARELSSYPRAQVAA